MIPLGRPWITTHDLAAVNDVLSSARLVQGTQVAAFEDELASQVGVEHAIAVSSGTAALAASIGALGVGAGDRVLVASYSWVATANVVELVGATPVFVDVDSDTLGMDPTHLVTIMENLGEHGLLDSVKAILPVYVFGYIPRMEEIIRVGRFHGIPVIEDAACALGAFTADQAAGSIGAAGCFSFHALKVVTTGEGGAITTDDDRLAEFARAYRNHGQTLRNGERCFQMAGPNLRMTDFQAALGRSQLNRLGTILDQRRDLIERYRQRLSGLPLRFQEYERDRTTGQAFSVFLKRPETRQFVQSTLRDLGVEAGSGTIAMPFSPYFRRRYGLTEADLPVTASIGRSALSLPLFNGMTHHDQDIVIVSLEKALEESSKGSGA